MSSVAAGFVLCIVLSPSLREGIAGSGDVRVVQRDLPVMMASERPDHEKDECNKSDAACERPECEMKTPRGAKSEIRTAQYESTDIIISLEGKDGMPVRNAWVVLHRNGQEPLSYTTTAGKALFPKISRGTTELFVRSIGMRFYKSTIEIVGNAATLELTIQLEPDPRCIPFKFVTSAGVPLSKALASQKMEAVASAMSFVAGSGAFERGAAVDPAVAGESIVEKKVSFRRPIKDSDSIVLDDEFDGYIKTNVDRPFVLTAVVFGVSLESHQVGHDDRCVTFRVDPDSIFNTCASIRVRVVDFDSGAPIPGAGVVMTRGEAADEHGVAAGRTDADGIASVLGVTAGSGWLEVRASGFGIASRGVSTMPGQSLDLGDMALERGRWIHGALHDASGKPVDGTVELYARGERGDIATVGRPLAVTSTNGGEFHFDHIASGQYIILVPARRPHASVAKRIDVARGADTRVDLERTPGVEFVIKRGNTSKERIQVTVLDAEGVPCAGGTLGGDVVSIRTLLARGRYTVRWTSHGQDVDQTVKVENESSEIVLSY